MVALFRRVPSSAPYALVRSTPRTRMNSPFESDAIWPATSPKATTSTKSVFAPFLGERLDAMVVRANVTAPAV